MIKEVIMNEEIHDIDEQIKNQVVDIINRTYQDIFFI